MYHFVYKLTKSDSGEYYIGKHSTDNLEDGYLGSGNWSKEIAKSGGGAIEKTILSFHESAADAYIAEKEFLGDLWKTDSLCKNAKPGGDSSFFERDTYTQYCLEKFGVTNHMKLEKYKDLTPGFRSKLVQEKVEETFKSVYGGKGSGSKIIKEKVERTNVTRYGVKHTLALEHVKNAREEACLEKFGVTNPFKSKAFQQSLTNPMDVPEYRSNHKTAMESKDWSDRNEKSKQTNMLRYGCSAAFNKPEVREKNSRMCPFCNRKFNAGGFSLHMSKIHRWSKEQIKDAKNVV